MPLPSKQEMVYSYLLSMFKENRFENGRLPSENALAAEIGVARRTLRYTLARLEDEGYLLRTNHGTYLRKQILPQDDIPVTVLVPCPDYQTASGYWSSYLINQMILGAMEAAVKAGTYVVTLPITINNDPSKLDLRQFHHLDSRSMVMISGAEWAPAVYQILIERKCRCGIISADSEPWEIFTEHDTPLLNYNLKNYWSCLGRGVKQLVEDGAERIVYLGRDSTDISKYGKRYFQEAYRALKREYSDRFYSVFPDRYDFRQVLERLADLYRETRFDGLIFDSNFFYELPCDFDFYGETGIPRETRMILGVNELLRCSDLPVHTRVLHRPQKKIAFQLAEFLLSGERGQYTYPYEYEFPYLEEFFRRTERKNG